MSIDDKNRELRETTAHLKRKREAYLKLEPLLDQETFNLEKSASAVRDNHSRQIREYLENARKTASLHQNFFPKIKRFLQAEKEKVLSGEFEGHFETQINGQFVSGTIKTSLPEKNNRDIILKLSNTGQEINLYYDVEKDIVKDYRFYTVKNSKYTPHFRFYVNDLGDDSSGIVSSNAEYYKPMDIKIVENRIREVTVGSKSFPVAKASFQAYFNSQGNLHNSDGPALVADDSYQQSFYYNGQKISDAQVSTLAITVQKSRDKIQRRKEQSAIPSKKKRFTKKEKVNIEDTEENTLLDRMILFDTIDDLRNDMRLKLSILNDFLKQIHNIFDKENEGFYGTIVYDEQEKEITITKELINELGLYSLDTFKEKYQDEYFSSITNDLKRLEKAHSGILAIIAEQTERPLGVKLGNPKTNIKNKNLQPLSQDCIYINKHQEGQNGNLAHMQDEEGLVYIMDNNGGIDNKAMVSYLTVEHTFTNDDLKEIIIKLENDIREIDMHIDNIKENIEIVKQHIQEHQIELKKEITQLLNSEEGAEEDNYFSASLKSEY